MNGTTGVRIRTASSWWEDHTNGDVTLVILRRVEQAAGKWNELRFRATSEAEAEAAYDDYSELANDRAQKVAARRLRWGPAAVSRPR